ncbi:Alpha/beta hydrolase fold-1 [Pterulicium gracile]|uniref:Alpha/beta hydrolase fold-1 n=1 Tax=Pterulicium gracile TaxID=1884261 RepID=A0A5C3Q4N4_9AGAR|nr:Alpha/beta hydrolase fold-1 [Pterula gracilis]
MSPLHSSTHLFDPRPDFPLLVSVKRYYDPATQCTDSDALTLVFAHAAGHMKEIWEPCMDELFALVKKNGLKVNDVWSIEAPNHGEAAAMNRRLLEWCYRPIFRTEDYARAIHVVLTNAGTGIDVDFTKRRLVGIGHSFGGLGMLLSPTVSPPIPWTALIAVDVMITAPTPKAITVQNFLAASTEKQVDTWTSLEQAREVMLKKAPWRSWDKRAFEAFSRYGLKPVDSADATGAVTLKTSKMDTAATYRDPHGLRRCYLYLGDLVQHIPVHMVFGAVPDVMEENTRNDIIDVASGGRDKLASLKLVEGAGHLITVTHPKELAGALSDALQAVARSPSQLARL